MKDIIITNRFSKELKRVKKRGYPLEKLGHIIDLLAKEIPLPSRCRPHKLIGNYGGLWECHIEPDWLLIYDILDDKIILTATGTHADLFE